MIQNSADVIIIGAGPAGCACAIELARAGKKVVVIERGKYAGSKNMFGGAIFENVVEKAYPNFLQNAPIERIITSHAYSLLSDNSSIDITYNDFNKQNNKNRSIIVNRSKFDRWCADEAKKEGAYFAYETVVRKILTDSKRRAIGIKTDLEDFYAPIIIIAEGANSLLTKQLGLRKNFTLNDEILSVKEVYEFENENILNQKLNLNANEGRMFEYIAGPLKNKFALGIIYTNKKSISIGLGVSMKDLIKSKKKPYELLDELKSVKEIANILEGAKPIEYSAHLIPESSPKTMPKLYSDGVMIIGDAAMLVNNLHFEGTNLAITSGIYAANVAINSLKIGKYDAKTLKEYEKLIKNSFIYKDISSYKNIMRTLHKNSDTFMGYYIDKANEFFKIFTQVNSIPKKEEYRKFIYTFLKGISPLRLIKDGINMIKLIIEAIF